MLFASGGAHAKNLLVLLMIDEVHTTSTSTLHGTVRARPAARAQPDQAGLPAVLTQLRPVFGLLGPCQLASFCPLGPAHAPLRGLPAQAAARARSRACPRPPCRSARRGATAYSKGELLALLLLFEAKVAVQLLPGLAEAARRAAAEQRRAGAAGQLRLHRRAAAGPRRARGGRRGGLGSAVGPVGRVCW
jgi:hypothetical protein